MTIQVRYIDRGKRHDGSWRIHRRRKATEFLTRSFRDCQDQWQQFLAQETPREQQWRKAHPQTW